MGRASLQARFGCAEQALQVVQEAEGAVAVAAGGDTAAAAASMMRSSLSMCYLLGS